ncbi:MAG TPA: phosphatase PAP2 family protein [Bryobacteraceae bacterium]|nr:phosphatase PAP2 family protein [Bryobacteraceae bacterium]
MSRSFFLARAGRLWMWLGGAALALLIFIRITRELIEGDVDAVDRAILLAVENKRVPWLTITAVDVTALGSITLVVLFSAFTLIVLLLLRDRMGALQLLAASAGAGILTVVTKDMIERIRPEEAQQLIVVSGFSYPSGHSVSTSALYLTIAIIAARYIQHPGTRAAIFLAVPAVVVMVGASRVYLGVHYATDVVSGISLGAAWALLLAGFFAIVGKRDSS